jgi:hypothetical protein
MNHDILTVLRGPELIGSTLFRFDKCSPPSQKNGKLSDALEAMAVGVIQPPDYKTSIRR